MITVLLITYFELKKNVPGTLQLKKKKQWKVDLSLTMKAALTGREQSFTPGGEPPLVPVPHPGASIWD